MQPTKLWIIEDSIQGLLDLLKPILGALLGNLGDVLGNLLNPNGRWIL